MLPLDKPRTREGKSFPGSTSSNGSYEPVSYHPEFFMGALAFLSFLFLPLDLHPLRKKPKPPTSLL